MKWTSRSEFHYWITLRHRKSVENLSIPYMSVVLCGEIMRSRNVVGMKVYSQHDTKLPRFLSMICIHYIHQAHCDKSILSSEKRDTSRSPC